MKAITFVFLGGGLGSVLRFLISKWTVNHYAGSFPMGTFLANILACFVLGLIISVFGPRFGLEENYRHLWVIGFCGGFSTFSTFSNETLQLFQSNQHIMAISYVLASVLLCILVLMAGLWLGQKL